MSRGPSGARDTSLAREGNRARERGAFPRTLMRRREFFPGGVLAAVLLTAGVLQGCGGSEVDGDQWGDPGGRKRTDANLSSSGAAGGEATVKLDARTDVRRDAASDVRAPGTGGAGGTPGT